MLDCQDWQLMFQISSFLTREKILRIDDVLSKNSLDILKLKVSRSNYAKVLNKVGLTQPSGCERWQICILAICKVHSDKIPDWQVFRKFEPVRHCRWRWTVDLDEETTFSLNDNKLLVCIGESFFNPFLFWTSHLVCLTFCKLCFVIR